MKSAAVKYPLFRNLSVPLSRIHLKRLVRTKQAMRTSIAMTFMANNAVVTGNWFNC